MAENETKRKIGQESYLRQKLYVHFINRNFRKFQMIWNHIFHPQKRKKVLKSKKKIIGTGRRIISGLFIVWIWSRETVPFTAQGRVERLFLVLDCGGKEFR